MNLTPAQKAIGRRNFMKAIAGTPALAALAGAAATAGPKKGGPVKAALIGAGGEGKVLLKQAPKNWIDLRAICDININQARGASEGMVGLGWPKPKAYDDLKQMLEKEDLEAVIIAVPLSAHADVAVACLEAGKHVLCEKMMAWDVASCQRMIDAATKNKRVLEIGYQRMYNPAYQAAYEGIIKKGGLGDIHYVRTYWHRNTDWRKALKEPAPATLDPTKFGYADLEHLTNWRLYRKHSRGLLAELGSHQICVANWFYGAHPEAVYCSSMLSKEKKDKGREVPDHVFATFEYPGGGTATFTSIETNEHDEYSEEILGTKGLLVFKKESEMYLFHEADTKAVGLEVTPRSANAIIDASESRAADAGNKRTVKGDGEPDQTFERVVGYTNEIGGFCSAIRIGTPLRCGPETAKNSAAAIIRAFESHEQKQRLLMT
jgi:predicted dehydrogenase